MQTEVEDGLICTIIDFEGVGNLSAIPVFDGISSPGWLGLIDADAGGSGNFAFEPSPQTIAFWLGGAPGARDIVFETPVAKVEFFYASFVTVTLQAFDQNGVQVSSASGPPNFNQGPGGDPNGSFNKWDPLSVETDENDITRVQVSGNVNQTGIDDLKVCRALRIESVEATQAIQEYQTLDDLKTDLQGDGEPPVPLIKGKPAALRVYMQQVQTVTTVRVDLDVPGVTTASRTLGLQPGCTAEDRRRRRNGCLSMDFYFRPPGGQWTATLRLFDDSDNQVEEHALTFVSRDADSLNLRAVSVCDDRITILGFLNFWQCAQASTLSGLADFLRRTAPTDSLTVTVTNNRVRRDTDDYDANGNGTVSGNEMVAWWVDTASDINNNFGFLDSIAGIFGQQRYYYGMVRPEIPGGIGGIANDIPGRGAASRTSAIRLGVETNREVVAHETGHMLGRRHTNTGVPGAAGAPPGCYSTATDPGTGWPFADNRIQSAAQLEVGFDVAAGNPVAPETNFDWMSYCTPRWISPFTYRNAMTALNATQVAPAALGGAAVGEFWTVSGLLPAGGGVQFGPLFTIETEAETALGSGSHHIEVRDAAGGALFTRFFTPSEPRTESVEGMDVDGIGVFYQLVPVQDGAARIVLVDDEGVEIGSLEFGGVAPTVSIDQPTGGETIDGIGQLMWSISDPDSSEHWSWVEYSSDGGASWASLGQFKDDVTLAEDFDLLPGSSGSALLRVTVSDGINTGSATSQPFSVGTKVPSVQIIGPASGSIFQEQAIVWLRASAYDVDDGILDEDSVVWESERDGDLGTGASLPLTTLSQGLHGITVTGTDIDGNAASASIGIVIAGGPPTLALDVLAVDELPTTCVRVTIDAQPALDSVALDTVDYSLDGGESWTAVDEGQLPFAFLVPGDGFFHLVARAFDAAGQVALQDAKFFIDSPCTSQNLPPVANAGPDQTVECNGPHGTPVALDGSASQDPDGDSLSFEWTDQNGNVVGVTAIVEVSLPLGVHEFGLTVEDGRGGSDSDTVTITVEDTTPPSLDSIAASPNLLWPPNHEMVPVNLAVSASDLCDPDPAMCEIVDVVSNEDIDGPGGGTTTSDWEITGDLTLDLRAERSGSGSGRVYTIEVSCMDASGNTASGSVGVTVPHDQRR